MKIGEFFVQLGVNAESATLKDFAHGISDMTLDAAAAIAEIGGLTYSLVKIAKEAANAAVGFDMFAATTGLSWQELQRWQNVAQQVNVSAEDVTSSIQALSHQMAEIRMGKGNLFPWQALGLDPRSKDAFRVLDQLRDKIKGMDRPMAVDLLQQLGLTPSMVKVLQLSNDEFSKLQKTVRGMTAEQEQGFLKAKQALTQFAMTQKYAGMEIVYHLVEGFERLYDALSKVKGMLPILAALGTALAYQFAPFLTIMTSLILILDDLAVYAMGGNSLFGKIVEMLNGGPKGSGGGAVGAFAKNNPNMTAIIAGMGSAFAGAAPAPGTPPITVNTYIQGAKEGARDIEEAIKKGVMKALAASHRQADNQSNNGGF